VRKEGKGRAEGKQGNGDVDEGRKEERKEQMKDGGTGVRD
jgi:hypothetical protein